MKKLFTHKRKTFNSQSKAAEFAKEIEKTAYDVLMFTEDGKKYKVCFVIKNF